MLDVPPDLMLVLMLICGLIVIVLLLLDGLEQQVKELTQVNIMLTRRMESAEADLAVWLGQPRKFLENDLEEEVRNR